MRLDELLCVTHGLVKVYDKSHVYHLFLDYADHKTFMSACSDVEHLFSRTVIKIIPLGSEWTKYIKVILG